MNEKTSSRFVSWFSFVGISPVPGKKLILLDAFRRNAINPFSNFDKNSKYQIANNHFISITRCHSKP